jgi:hypothetical protein
MIHGTSVWFGYVTVPTPIYIASEIDNILDGYDVTIAGKFNTPVGNTSQYVRGDGSLATLPAATAAKKVETFLGTTDASGNYTVTYGTAYTATPDVQPQIQAGSSSDTRTIRITASSTTGFTVNVRNRTDVVGLLPTYANVSGASVGVLVTER